MISKLLKNAAVYYEPGNLMGRRMAYRIASLLSERVGSKIPFSWEMRECAAKILLCDDPTLSGGAWKIEVAGNTVTLRAATYYGYTGILKFLAGDGAGGLYALTDGYVATGDYLDFPLGEFERSTKYAYDKKGNQRIMFYNVLWERPRPALRNPLAAEMVRQYLPDVLGCQEFNASKRGDFVASATTNTLGIASNPDASLDELLKKVGYKETIPRDVGVHPFYNNTPLFYNPKTTKLIKSEYFWYKDQIDDENRNNCGVGDCASKAITWGVFETKATGKRYIVLSTHMCTRSNGVRGLQAIEAVDLIKRLTEKYQCPAFLGGDYNGLPKHANYVYFTSEGVNYTDVALNGVAKEFASITRTHHTYPLYNPELDLELVAPDDNTCESLECIDHIMMTNADNVEVNVYGVVVDHCSQSGSDHYPIFADFNL